MPRSRPARLSIRFTVDELGRVRRHARARGLAPSSYLRFLALEQELPPPPPGQPTREAIAQLARVGNNLNQLAKWANEHGHLPAMAELQVTLDAVRAAATRLAP